MQEESEDGKRRRKQRRKQGRKGKKSLSFFFFSLPNQFRAELMWKKQQKLDFAALTHLTHTRRLQLRSGKSDVDDERWWWKKERESSSSSQTHQSIIMLIVLYFLPLFVYHFIHWVQLLFEFNSVFNDGETLLVLVFFHVYFHFVS